jgi:hypothetical protein
MDSCRIVSPPHPRVNEHAGDPLKNRYEAASRGFSRRWVIEDLATTGHSVWGRTHVVDRERCVRDEDLMGLEWKIRCDLGG